MLHRYGLTKYKDPSKAFIWFTQTSNIEAYQKAFKRLSHQVDDIPNTFLIECFIAGIPDDIRLDSKSNNHVHWPMQ